MSLRILSSRILITLFLLKRKKPQKAAFPVGCTLRRPHRGIKITHPVECAIAQAYSSRKVPNRRAEIEDPLRGIPISSRPYAVLCRGHLNQYRHTYSSCRVPHGTICLYHTRFSAGCQCFCSMRLKPSPSTSSVDTTMRKASGSQSCTRVRSWYISERRTAQSSTRLSSPV